MKETALGLLIPEDTDAPNGPAQIGGNAEKADALLQAGGVGKSLWIPGAVTRASTSNGSFSTPIKIELPRAKENQLIEIRAFGKAKASVESNVSGGGNLRCEVNTGGIGRSLYELNGNFGLFAGTPITFGFKEGAFATAVQPERGKGGIKAFSGGSFAVVAAAEYKPLVIEITGFCTPSGTLTVEEVWLSAWVSG